MDYLTGILYFLIQPGDKVMILPDVSSEEANKVFPDVDTVNMPSGKEYVRSTFKYWYSDIPKMCKNNIVNVATRWINF